VSLSDRLKPELLAAQDEVTDLRAALQRAHREITKAKNRDAHLVAVITQACHDAVLATPLQRVPKPAKDRRSKGAEVALWHLTDWQGAKVTPSYNSQVMRERVHRFVDKATRITEIQRADHPVRDCTIALGGDMIEGLFNFPTQPYEIDATLFGQFVTVSNLLVEIVRRALAVYERVTVVPEWGNHGRIGSKRDAVVKSDNADRMTYELARQVLAASGETRLTWQDCPEDIQRLEIGNYRALLMHGDEVGRAGFASPSAWQAAGNRWKAGAYGWDFQDIYLGHYHRHAQEPLSDGLGAIYWTGSSESENRYARDSMAASGVPSQRLHFIDPDAGRVTSGYQVWLDS
jgi:hypothetical protein